MHSILLTEDRQDVIERANAAGESEVQVADSICAPLRGCALNNASRPRALLKAGYEKILPGLRRISRRPELLWKLPFLQEQLKIIVAKRTLWGKRSPGMARPVLIAH